MKTLTSTNLIAVEVPKEAKDIRLNEFGTFIFYQDNGKRAYHLDFFASEILGEVTDTEVSQELYEFLKFEWCWCENEFRSLLQSNGIYFQNPMGKINIEDYAWGDVNIGVYRAGLEKWQSYESKLIKGKLIILKRK